MMNVIKAVFNKYKEPILYVVFGVLSTVVNFAVFYLMNRAAGEELYLVNNVVAWLAAVIFAYIANKLWVFESKSFKAKVILKEISEFFAARIFSFAVEEGGLWLFVDKLGFDNFSFSIFGFEVTGKLIAKLALAVIVIILNYIFSKFIIFKKNKNNKTRPA